MHDDRLLIDVVNHVDVHVIHPSVIEEVAAVPAAAEVAGAGVAESVVDAAVEADFRAPVSGVPEIGAVGPAPVAGRPEKTYLGRFHPRARDPEISSVVAIAPVARRPDIAIAGANGLRVNGKDGWGDGDRENDLR